MELNLNLTSPAETGNAPASSTPSAANGNTAVYCYNCGVDLGSAMTGSVWQICWACQKREQIRWWPAVRQKTNAVVAFSDQATCFFHPDKAFQACCQRCGRFVCGLCDLQLGAEHVCPTCFERGRAEPSTQAGATDWRYRDILYDSIAISVGWGWILFWPSIVAAIPAVIFLHVKHRKAPRSYLIPRSGWRFWVAYVGLAWLPLLIGSAFLATWRIRRH